MDGEKKRRLLIGLLLLGIVAIVAAAVGGSAGGESTTGSTGGSRSPEQSLAFLETGSTSPDVVASYSRALDAAERACSDSRSNLADMAYRAHELAGEEGVEASALDMLRDVDASVPEDARPMPCADMFASLVILQR